VITDSRSNCLDSRAVADDTEFHTYLSASAGKNRAALATDCETD
jgi:hypothetical protein